MTYTETKDESKAKAKFKISERRKAKRQELKAIYSNLTPEQKQIFDEKVKVKRSIAKKLKLEKEESKMKAGNIKVHIFNGLSHDILEAEITQKNNRNNYNIKLLDGTIINNIIRKENLSKNFTHCNYF